MAFIEDLGLGVLSGLGSLITGQVNQGTSFSDSKRLMAYQARLNNAFINKQNAYNSPVAQIERLKVAGLSPNLVYGNGVDGNQSSAANVGTVSRHGQYQNPLQDAIVAYQNNRLYRAQLQKNEADIKKSIAESKLLDAKTTEQLTSNRWQDDFLTEKLEKVRQDIATGLAQEYNTWALTRANEERYFQIHEEIDYIKSKKNLTDKQAATEIVRKNALEEGIKLTKAQVEKIGAELPYIKAGTDLRKMAAKIQGVEFDATKAGDQWLAEHPTVAIIYNLLCKMLGVGKDVAGLIPGM